MSTNQNEICPVTSL